MWPLKNYQLTSEYKKMNSMTNTPFIQEAKRLNAWSTNELSDKELKSHGKGAFYIRHSIRYANLNGVTVTIFYEGCAKNLKASFKGRGYEAWKDEEQVARIIKVAYVYDTIRRVYRDASDTTNNTANYVQFKNIREFLLYSEDSLGIPLKGITFDFQGKANLNAFDYVTLNSF